MTQRTLAIASAITIGFAPAQVTSIDQYVAIQELGLALQRLSPGTLFSVHLARGRPATPALPPATA